MKDGTVEDGTDKKDVANDSSPSSSSCSSSSLSSGIGIKKLHKDKIKTRINEKFNKYQKTIIPNLQP